MYHALPMAVILSFQLALGWPFIILLIHCPLLAVAATAVTITTVGGGFAAFPGC